MSESVEYKKGRLCLMGHDLSRVALGNSTPTYVYSFDRVAQKLKLLRDSFSGPLHIHYAMKTNFNRELLKRLALTGIGADVVSGGEVARALECGFRGANIIFSGVAKTRDEINYSLDNHVGIFNVESPQELSRIGELALKKRMEASVSFRINPNVNAKTHPYITTGFKENKFGLDKSFIPELLTILKKYKSSLQLVGIGFHIGSQLLDIKPFIEALKKSIPIYEALENQGHRLKFFDVGGGFGIPYQGQKPFEIKKYAKEVEALLRPLGCEIACEPGRYLVGDAGVLLTQVEYVKKTPHKTFIIVNTGMHHLLRPALYEAHHEILPVIKKSGAMKKVDVVGPICESSDWLARDRRLPPLLQDEILAICDTGAYGFTMASHYNLHPFPKEVFVD